MLRWLRVLRNRLLLLSATRQGLRLGENVRIMGKPQFGSEPYLISIGNNVTISHGVAFLTHDGATWVFRRRPQYEGMMRFGRIDIEDDCFIGARAILMPGIRIGRGSIVGAGAVVTKSVPPGTVVAGVPARPICTTEQYIERAVARCTRYPPDILADRRRLQAVLMEQFPPQAAPNDIARVGQQTSDF